MAAKIIITTEDEFLAANEEINNLLDDEDYYAMKGWWGEFDNAGERRRALQDACDLYEGQQIYASVHDWVQRNPEAWA